MAKFVLTAQMKLAAPTNTAAIVSQINQQLKGINAFVNIKVNNQAVTQLNKVNKALTTTGKNAKVASIGLERFGKDAALAIRRFGAFVAATFAFRKFVSAISSGFSEAIKFERELIKIAQVTDTSARNLKGLTSEITRLSTTFGVSFSSLLKVSRVLSQTGLTADQTKIALEALAKTSLSATFDDINQTAEASIAIMRQFKVESSELESVFGAINAVAGKFAVEAGDINVAIRRTGGAFRAAGGELNELIALFTSVRATSRESAESIATGFRTIFTRLQRTRTINFLKTLGVDLRTFDGQFVGPLEAIKRLNAALKNVRTTDPRFAQIVEELGGFRQISKVIPLIQQFDEAQRALNVAQAGGTSLSRDAAKAQQTLAVQIAKVREEFNQLIRKIAGTNTFKVFAKTALRLASALIKVADALTPLIGIIAALAVPIAASGFSRFLGAKAGAGFTGTLRGFASGGVVPGVGSRDTIPARLTPGEFVINKKAAQVIGLSNLERLNDTQKIQKFQKGGVVGGGIGGVGLSAAILILPSVIGTLVDKFTKMDSAVGEVVNTVTQLGIQFVVFQALLRSTSNTGFAASARARIPGTAEFSRQRGPLAASRQRLGASVIQQRKDISVLNKKIDIGQQNVSNIRTRIASVPVGSVQRADFQSRLSRREGRLDLQRDVANRSSRRLDVSRAIGRQSTIARNRRVERLEARQGGTLVAGAALGAIGNVAGGFISSRANARIAAGQDASGTAAIGGALSGAGTGAALGAIFGPFGIAIGAATGGLIGFFTASKAAKEQLEAVKFNNVIGNLSKTLENVDKGFTTVSTATSSVASTINALDDRFVTATSPEAIEELNGAVRNTRPQIETFIQKLAQTSGSFQQIDAILGKGVLQKFATINSIPFDSLKNRIEDQINLRKRATEINERAIDVQLLFINRVRAISDLSSVIKDATQATSKFSAAISGSLTILDQSDVLSRPSNIADQGLFQQAVRSATQPFGARGQTIGRDAIASQRAISQLPDILLSLSAEDPLGQRGDFISRLNKAVSGLIGEGAESDFIKEAIINRARGLIGAEGKDVTILELISKDLNKVSKDLSKGFDPLFAVLAEISKAIAGQLNLVVQATNKRRELEFKILDQTQKLINQQLTTDKFRNVNRVRLGGRDNRLRLSDAADTLRQRATLRGTGVRTGDVEETSRALQLSQQRLTAITLQLNDAASRGLQADITLIFTRDRLIERAGRLTKQLEFLGNSSARAAESQRELDKIRENSEKRFSVAADFAFGSKESRRDTVKSIQFVTALGTGRRNINQLSDEGRGLVGQLLSKLGDTDRFAAFGRNREGQDRTVAEFRKILVSQSLGGGRDAIQIALLSTTNKEQELINKIDQLLTQGEAARRALINDLRTQQTTVIQQIRDALFTFVGKLQELFLRRELSRIGRQSVSQEGQIVERTSQIAAAQRIQRAFGGRERAEVITGRLRNFQNLREREESFGAARVASFARNLEGSPIEIEDVKFGQLVTVESVKNITTAIRERVRDELAGQFPEEFAKFQSQIAKVGLGSEFGVSERSFIEGATPEQINTALLRFINTKTEEIFKSTFGGAISETSASRSVALSKLREEGFTRQDIGKALPILLQIEKDLQLSEGVDLSKAVQDLDRLVQDTTALSREYNAINNSLTISLRSQQERERLIQQRSVTPVIQQAPIDRPANTIANEDIAAARRIVAQRAANAAANAARQPRRGVQGLGQAQFSVPPENLDGRGAFGEPRPQAIAKLISGTGDAEGTNKLQETMIAFSNTSGTLATALDNFPREVQHMINGKVEIIVNGAEVFARIMPEIQELINTRIKDGINKFTKKNFPELGPQEDE